MSESPLPGLARRLITEGLIDEKTARVAVKAAHINKTPLITHIVRSELVSGYAIAKLNSEIFGIPIIDIDAIELEHVPHDAISEKLVRQHRTIPLFKRGNKLFVGVSDPTDEKAIEEIRFSSGNIELILVEENKLSNAVEKTLETVTQDLGDLDDEELNNLDIDHMGKEHEEDIEARNEDAPIVKFVHKMLLTAIKLGASDLHFEPYEKSYRIRFRIDGVMQSVAQPPIGLAPKLSSRLKIMSNMDISERRKPQDGRIKLKLSKTKAIDFRVNTLPTLWGEKIVLRILDPSSAKMGIDALGYEKDQKKMYLKALEQPQGMILVTGPTGSGKTVSLYTGLNILNTVERNISTAEDPVEINLEGINQVNVNPRQGMDFTQALRAFLRQDPDIIMVGEIRDIETANIAIKAAQTGHMVMSTLHTNSAPETLTRLLNMGVAAFNLATSVNLIIAQRLGRKLCNSCKIKQDIPVETLLEQGFTTDQASSATIYTHDPSGCDKCNRGYKGRVGIYEVVEITQNLQKIIMEEGNAMQIAEQAQKEGFLNLRQAGLLKVLKGTTSLEEINRVTLD
ncbi:type IV-A pilus assembly ATPase PilB [Sansalvadorimonas sp. 2012CJ34-2]|uniref:Type IV-A pilus assembly ATPase PilB n=1 Tax=Parendozoicomonas callyspongiae TaxID=2942213 RepID=A0ABT0PF10_9GAMM|nr:type IV-A pilus assembly ATPase PilB [Sansalvadorimonas sp. 2012CJ34-2]MCL6269967.1 type IV-A pilus assembly ATPase PilB [Sansalvadorimonas sp. 2012CJ34-2]